MDADKMDLGRRQFLTAATSVVGGVGLGLAAVPFVSSWLPSAKARSLGAPIKVDISKLESGQKITVAWRGQPIIIVNRPEQKVKDLPNLDKQLRDPNSDNSIQPDYVNPVYRSIKNNILVLVGICTHLGCVPLYKPKAGSIDAQWPGGFFCPCHGSKFDLAGRVYKGVPAPTNLTVPPYKYLDETLLLIGEDSA